MRHKHEYLRRVRGFVTRPYFWTAALCFRHKTLSCGTNYVRRSSVDVHLDHAGTRLRVWPDAQLPGVGSVFYNLKSIIINL